MKPLLMRLVRGKGQIDYRSELADTGIDISSAPQSDGSTTYAVTIRKDAGAEQVRGLEAIVARG